MPDSLQKLAPVKVNLCLHVGGVRSDGLHELASLTVFPDYGDLITVTAADEMTLGITGPFAAQLGDLPAEQNLILKAARALQKMGNTRKTAHISLEKNVPAASGIGGGTSDAATTLFLLRQLWHLDLSNAALLSLAFGIGADGPVCLMPHLSDTGTAIMTGAGETVVPGPALPPLWICLVNPLHEVPTGEVFRRFDTRRPAPDLPVLPRFKDISIFGQETRNDLHPFAEQLCPEIAPVLAMLSAQSGVIWARMSGSGATCFALYETADAAMAAAQSARRNGWWGKAAKV